MDFMSKKICTVLKRQRLKLLESQAVLLCNIDVVPQDGEVSQSG